MPYQKGCKPGPGRPKGYKEKFTESAKVAFEMAFEGIGGVPALITWAQANTSDFYKLYARLIPVNAQVSGVDGGPLTISVNFVGKDSTG